MTLREFLSKTVDSHLDLHVVQHDGEEFINSYTAEKCRWNTANIPDDVLDMEILFITPHSDHIIVEVDPYLETEDLILTKEMVREGYKKRLISVILSPNDDGIACKIGDNWFLFDTESEYETVREYTRAVSKEMIIEKIWETINDFRTACDELKDEYMYYFYFLCENL